MLIKKYSEESKLLWDEFINKSKNGHFMFKRDYMEYHADRFNDFSLIVEDTKGKIIGLLPANIKDNTLYSHQGLTFGGFIIDEKMKTETMLDIFDSLKLYLRDKQVSKLIYKCVPHIYHIIPSEEDRYALFCQNARLIRRDVTSTIYLDEKIRYSKGRKWSINKAKKENLTVVKSDDFSIFWSILEDVLRNQHSAQPVHTLAEIKNLASLFPNNISLYLTLKDNEPLAGAVIYENLNTVHTQYLANNDLGRDVGALDFLTDYLIKETYKDKKFFDFGISNEEEGTILNKGLIAQKEGFGARPVVHDFYEVVIK